MENQASHIYNWLDLISFIENHHKKIGDWKIDQSRHWEFSNLVNHTRAFAKTAKIWGTVYCLEEGQ